MWQVPHPPTGLWSNIVDLRGKNTQKGFSQLQIFVPYSTVNVFLAVVPMQYIHYGLARCTLTLNLMAHLNVSYLPDPPNSARAWYSGRSMPDIKHLGRLLLCTSMYLGVPQCTSCLYLNVWRISNGWTVSTLYLDVLSLWSLCSDCQLLYLNSHEPHSGHSNGAIYQATQARNIEL